VPAQENDDSAASFGIRETAFGHSAPSFKNTTPMNKQDIAAYEATNENNKPPQVEELVICTPRVSQGAIADLFPALKQVDQFDFFHFLGTAGANHIEKVYEADGFYPVRTIHFVTREGGEFVAVMYSSRPDSVVLDRYLINEKFLSPLV
jgi:hypothetical protein